MNTSHPTSEQGTSRIAKQDRPSQPPAVARSSSATPPASTPASEGATGPTAPPKRPYVPHFPASALPPELLEADLLPPLPTEPEAPRPLPAAEAAALALTPPQRLAIEHLTSGYSLVSCAKAAGVTRMTLYRWINHDARFQAAYNAWQLDALTAARTRLLAATDDAVTTVVNAVRTDPRIAMTVLKSVGALDRPAPGATDPDEVQQLMDIAREKSEADLGQQRFFASLGSGSLAGLGLDSGKKRKPSAQDLIAELGKEG